MKRIIFHIDVNNAFLSWTAVKMVKEGKEDIRKIPSVIGGDESSRHGIVLAKSPIAKKMGIKTAMSLYEARKICKDLKVYQPDFKTYFDLSNKFYEYLKEYSPTIERFSIDECFIDFTGTNYLYDDYIKLAHKIKDEIKEKYGFTVNVGIGENKLCAKMASDFEKPDKVHTLFNDEIVIKMWPLKVENLFMLGKKTKEKLNKMKIYTIKDLANSDPKKLEKEFKSYGKYLYDASHGIDNDEVKKREAKNKSISTEMTLKYNEVDPKKLKETIYSQIIELGRKLRSKKMYAKTVGIIYKNYMFQRYSAQATLEEATNSNGDLYKKAVEVFDNSYRNDPIRLIGVKLSNLTKSVEKQISIFTLDEDVETNDVQETIDEINNKLGKDLIEPASLKLIGKTKNKKSFKE